MKTKQFLTIVVILLLAVTAIGVTGTTALFHDSESITFVMRTASLELEVKVDGQSLQDGAYLLGDNLKPGDSGHFDLVLTNTGTIPGIASVKLTNSPGFLKVGIDDNGTHVIAPGETYTVGVKWHIPVDIGSEVSGKDFGLKFVIDLIQE